VVNSTVYDSNSFGEGYVGPDTVGFSTVASSSNGRRGIYTVRVRRVGYLLWQRFDVRVDGDRCGADATDLQVRLKPAP